MSILKTAVVFRIYAVVSVYNTHLVYVAVSLQHMRQVRSSLPLLRSLLRCRSVRLTLNYTI
jgi:hypothetical protein